MEKQIVGSITFANNRMGHAFSIIQDEYIDGQMWKEECMRKEEEIERLKKLLRRKHGKQVKR